MRNKGDRNVTVLEMRWVGGKVVWFVWSRLTHDIETAHVGHQCESGAGEGQAIGRTSNVAWRAVSVRCARRGREGVPPG